MRYLGGILTLSVIVVLSTTTFAGLHKKNQTTTNLDAKYYLHLKPAHQAALKRWLVDKKWLRPAIQADCTDDENLALMRIEWRKDFDPYYALGDFNRDGKEDFAVLLIDQRNTDPGFAIAIFNAPFKARAPNYFERGYRAVGNSYLAYNYIEKRRLFLGKYESDFYCVIFSPRGRKYVFLDCSP